jgi:hypothetical protein
LTILKDQWIRETDEYVFKKSVTRMQVRSHKKIKSDIDMLLKRLSISFEMINSLEITEETEGKKLIIDTAFEYTTFSLRKHISEKIGKNKKRKSFRLISIRRRLNRMGYSNEDMELYLREEMAKLDSQESALNDVIAKLKYLRMVILQRQQMGTWINMNKS